MDARPIPNTDSVIATATNHNGPCRGGIVVIDPTKGANSREAVRNLTPEVDIYRVGGVYGMQSGASPVPSSHLKTR